MSILSLCSLINHYRSCFLSLLFNFPGTTQLASDRSRTRIWLSDFQISVLFIVKHWVNTDVSEITVLGGENIGFDTLAFFQVQLWPKCPLTDVIHKETQRPLPLGFCSGT